jgi:indolepyruvate ferredoxin oxidoreductase
MLRELSDNRMKALVTGLAARTDLAAGSDEQKIADAYRAYMDQARVDQLDATALATALLGDAIGANLLLLGYAFQKGLLPLGLDSLMRAVELNATAVEMNKAAFAWGRCAAADLPRVLAGAGLAASPPPAMTLDDIIAHRVAHLTAYQSRRYARRYRRLVEHVRETEGRMFSGSSALAEAVARNYAKVLAYKDEYEVARLYAAPAFRERLAAQFEGASRIEVHLAPPLLARRDASGHLRKRAFGPWVFRAFRALAPLRVLRGTPLDIFGHTEERRAERALIGQYEADMHEALTALRPDTLAPAVALAGLPDGIRGFGHVKDKAMRAAAAERARLLEKLRAPAHKLPMAAE